MGLQEPTAATLMLVVLPLPSDGICKLVKLLEIVDLKNEMMFLGDLLFSISRLELCCLQDLLDDPRILYSCI